MKKIFIIISVLLLSACSSVPPSASTPIPPTPVVEYAGKTEPVWEIIESISSTLDSLHAQAEIEQSLLNNQDWQYKVVITSDQLLNAVNDLENISPIPPETELIQSYNESASFHIRASIADQMVYLSTGNEEYLESARNQLDLSMGYLRAAKTTLHIAQNP